MMSQFQNSESEVEQGRETASAQQMKRCVHCGERKSIDEFYKATGRRDGRESWCRECRNVQQKDAYHNMDPIRYFRRARQRRDTRLKRNYGISREEYDRLFHEQGGVCAVCDNPETRFDKHNNCFSALSVDHDHETGQARGLLCFNCNSAYGLLKEDAERIRALLVYHHRVHGGES